MTIRVPRLMPTLHGPAADIDHPGSSGQFARPAAEALAHLGGYVLRGMTAVIVGRTYTSTQTVRWYHYRSPNCDYLLIWLRLGDVSQSAAQITGQAGTGTAQTISAYYPAMGAGTVQRQMLLPWGATDSGYQEVTLTIAYAGIQDVMCCEVYRDVLDPASDDAVQQTDSSASLGGLGEGQYIIASSTAGLQGINGLLDQPLDVVPFVNLKGGDVGYEVRAPWVVGLEEVAGVGLYAVGQVWLTTNTIHTWFILFIKSNLRCRCAVILYPQTRSLILDTQLSIKRLQQPDIFLIAVSEDVHV